MLSPAAPFDACPAFGAEPVPAGDPLAFSSAACHELYAARATDAAAMSGLALGLAQHTAPRPLLWVRQAMLGYEAGAPYPPGIAELGVDPGRLILVEARDMASALQAGLEGARCAALGAVLIEIWGEARVLDLTASRRLALAAKASGILLLMVRIAARPQPSAAASRWEVRAAASRARAANAPGGPAFDLLLLRGRNRPDGARHHLEWDRDAQTFTPFATRGNGWGDRAALSGAVVSVPGNRPGGAGEGRFRRAG